MRAGALSISRIPFAAQGRIRIGPFSSMAGMATACRASAYARSFSPRATKRITK